MGLNPVISIYVLEVINDLNLLLLSLTQKGKIEPLTLLNWK